MRRTYYLLLLAVVGSAFGPLGCGGSAGSTSLQGAGATFPAPLYQRWFSEYNKQHPNVQVNYQALGSGAGIKQFTEQLVNFGASDAAMTDEQIEKVEDGVVLIPATAGSIVLAYNLPEVSDHLKLTREAYAGIFLGKVTRWNDPAIASANPGVTLPDLPIQVAYRAEGSGTTFVFTQHLSAISEEWKSGPGAGLTVVWPCKGVGCKGNQGIAAQIQQTPGAIGYLEHGFATQNKMAHAELQNKNGKFVASSTASGQAALGSAALPENLRAWIPDPEGDESYPIVTYSWILCYKKYDDPLTAATLKDVLRFGLKQGQQFSEELGYIPLPPAVAEKVLEAVDRIKP